MERWTFSSVYDLGGSLFLINGVEEIDRKREKRRGVMLAGNFAHRLQEAQLQRNRLLAHHRRRPAPFFPQLEIRPRR